MNYDYDENDMKNRGKTGLVNLGNTCYINSASQCLSHTRELRDFFLKGEYEKYQNKGHKSSVLVDEWYDMLTRLWAYNRGVAPRSYVMNVQRISRQHGDFAMFGGFSQNDSQEYLGFFMNQLHDVIARKVNMKVNGEVVSEKDRLFKKAYENWVLHFKNSYSKFVDIFYGQIINIVDCPETKEKSYTFEPQGMFPLSLPQHVHDNKLTLDHCFRYYTRHSVLDGDNAWHSEKSGKKHKAYRFTRFWRLPKYLILILKRFDMMGSKRNDEIEFPERLDMEPYCVLSAQQTKYRLYGVINHFGDVFGGHYIAHCRNGEQWRCFDDMNVTNVSVDKVLSEKQSAYVLFYERQDDQEGEEDTGEDAGASEKEGGDADVGEDATNDEN
jgi:ubiquitin C-terminal hydrolase